MTCGGKAGHVGTGLGDDDVGGQGTDAGNGADQVAKPVKGRDRLLDAGGDVVDGCGVLVDQVKVNPGQEPVMVGEPTPQRLGQCRDLGPQSAFGQIGQCGGVVVSSNQRLQHGASGDTEDVGGDGGQFDTRVFEQLLQPLHLTRALPGDRRARPG